MSIHDSHHLPSDCTRQNRIGTCNRARQWVVLRIAVFRDSGIFLSYFSTYATSALSAPLVSESPMDEADMNSGVSQLGIEEERILASFSRRLIKIAVVACGREAGAFATNALNRIRLPAIVLDRRGFVVEVNAAAGAARSR